MEIKKTKIEYMNIVIVGHVDHGKSTVIGRLLADTNSLPQGKLEQIKEKCRMNSRPFEYAFLIDALKDEYEQGITIDTARCFFNTENRNYIIIDAPGHVEFLKNMVTGASRAEAAIVVIDANEGIKENSKRHAFLLSMLGIKQLGVLVNKMDLVDYNEKVYKNIVEEYNTFLNKIGIEPSVFIPISGINGENIITRSNNMKWYRGITVLEALEVFEAEKPAQDKPFRMPVQGVYKFAKEGDNRRIVVGTVETGIVSEGDEITFYPSGKKSRVKSIEAFNEDRKTSESAGSALGFTLVDQIYLKRGDVATIASQKKPKVANRIKVNLFWLGKKSMLKNKKYFMKIGTSKTTVIIEEIIRRIDASTLMEKSTEFIERNDVAECVLRVDKAIAFDVVNDILQTSRFVIIDNYEISGGGIIYEALEDKQSWGRKKVIERNYKWEKSDISGKERAEKYKQKSVFVLITGQRDNENRNIAKALEKQLFENGKIIYFFDIRNILYGLEGDIKLFTPDQKEEYLRKLVEITKVMLDSGLILIGNTVGLTIDDIQEIKSVVNPEKVKVICLGEKITTDAEFDLHIKKANHIENAVDIIITFLQEKSII